MFTPLSWVQWLMGLLIYLLRTPFIEFQVRILDEERAKVLAQAIQDGTITDEELADLLELIRVELAPQKRQKRGELS